MGTKVVKVNENDLEWKSAVGLMAGIERRGAEALRRRHDAPPLRGRRDRPVYRPESGSRRDIESRSTSITSDMESTF